MAFRSQYTQYVFSLLGLLLLSQATSWAQCFQNMLNLPVGLQPQSVAVADLNRDNKPDLAVANSNSNTVSVLLNDGLGGFGGKTDFAVGTQPRSVTVGDFNSDGNPDLVTANYNNNTVSVLLGNGTGGFGAKVDFAVGSNPSSVAVGDFNNDDKPDLITTNQGSGNVSVLLGNGAGGFGAAINFGVGSSPQSVAVADFNDDDLLDIAVANSGNNTVLVALGTGTGGFNNAIPFQGDAVPVSVAVGSFNGDGKPDLAVANNSGSSVSVMLGFGFGIFPTSPEFEVNPQPYTVAVEDFNGDGYDDLVSASDAYSTVSVLLGDGQGGFGPKADFGVGSRPQSVAVGDFNGDGKPDLVTANYSSNTVSVLYNCTIPAPTLSVSASPNPVCAGSTVALSVTATGGTTGMPDYTYTWAAPEGITLSATSTSAVSASVGADVSGVQTLTVTVASLSAENSISTRLVSLTVNAPPSTVTFRQNGTLDCKDDEIEIIVDADGGTNNTYAFSDGAIRGGGPNTSFARVRSGGVYSVTVTNSGGCSTVASTTVITDRQVPENVTLSNNGPLTCSQTSVTLTASSTTPGVGYSFVGVASSEGIATVNQARQYTVLAIGPNGCINGATTTVESNTTAPAATLTNNGPITCTNRTVTLIADGGNSYVFSNGTTANGNRATVSNEGVYSVTVTGANGCTAIQTTEVTGNTTPPQGVTLTTDGNITCNKATVQLTAASSTSGTLTYLFSGPGSSSITQTGGPSATVTAEGTYTVTVTGANGCTATATTDVTGSTTPPENVSLTNTGPLSFTNTSIRLLATPDNNYSYSFSQGATQQGTTNSATVTTTGVFSVTVTRQDNGCTATASTTVTGGNNPTVCRGGTAVINVVVEGDPVKYEWYKNSLTSPKLMETPQLFRGTATSSLTLINAQSNTQGNFFLKVTDRSGQVKVYGPYRLTVDASCRAREIAQLETPLQVELAPNPIQQERLQAIVRGAEGRSLQVELVDLSGKPIRQQRWTQAEPQQRIDWDMQGQSSGLYLLQVVSEGGAGLPTQRQSVKVAKP
ncbi:hypothetical protein GCM10027341_17250 [Spirosoma knui]